MDSHGPKGPRNDTLLDFSQPKDGLSRPFLIVAMTITQVLV